KLQRAKQRLHRTLQNHPALATKLSQDLVVKLEKEVLPASAGQVLPQPEELDEEDIMIERLLLVNVAEAVILDGYYQSARELSTAEKNIALDSEHLTEADLPETELNKFIRRPEEVSRLQERPPKRAKPDQLPSAAVPAPSPSS